MRHTSYASRVIHASRERVWEYFSDFNGLARFHPAIKASELEPLSSPLDVGRIRRLTLEDGYVREKLLRISPSDFQLEYCIVETSMPVRNYVAGISLEPVTDSGRTFAQWWADFSVQGDDLESIAQAISAQVFAAGLRCIDELESGKAG
jgi:Polyketide cyclase / dehydrase and lipid transport